MISAVGGGSGLCAVAGAFAVPHRPTYKKVRQGRVEVTNCTMSVAADQTTSPENASLRVNIRGQSAVLELSTATSTVTGKYNSGEQHGVKTSNFHP